MTKTMLMKQPRIRNVLSCLERGMLDLIQAVDTISQYYKDGNLDYESAIGAIRLLSRAKVPV